MNAPVPDGDVGTVMALAEATHDVVTMWQDVRRAAEEPPQEFAEALDRLLAAYVRRFEHVIRTPDRPEEGVSPPSVTE